MAQIKVTARGKVWEYHCPDHITLLNQSLNEDEKVGRAAKGAGESMELPFSCMSGSCTTCKARLLGGKVEMADHSSLTDGELAEGWILTCQAMPRSDFVQIKISD